MVARLDKDYVGNLRSHLEGIWSDAWANWSLTDSFLDLNFAVWTKPEHRDRPSFHPPHGPAIIRHAVDNLLAFEPRVQRNPTGASQKAKSDANQVENWLESAFFETQLLEPSLTWKQVGYHLAAYGYAVVDAPRWNSSQKPDRPERQEGESRADHEVRLLAWENEKKTWMPLRVRAPHPAQLLLDPMEKRPQEGIRLGRHTVGQIRNIIQQRTGSNGRARRGILRRLELPDNPFDTLETMEYWSMDWHSFWVGTEELFIEPNIWRLMPYKHAFIGDGHEVTRAAPFNPRWLARGVIDDVRESLRAHAQEVNARHNHYVNSGFFDLVTDGDAEALRDMLAAGDSILEVQPGQTIKAMEIPQLTPIMLQSEGMLEQAIEQSTLSSALAGTKQAGVNTVGQQAILSTAANKRLLSALRQIEQLATWTAQDMLRMIDLNKETLYTRGEKISPSQINHDYSVLVQFPVRDPAFELQERQVAQAEVTLGLLDKESYWQVAGHTDSTAIRDGIIEDRLLDSPAVQEMMAMEAARRIGLATLLRQMQQAQVGQATGTPQSNQLLGPNGRPMGELTGAQSTEQGRGAVTRQALTNEVQNPPRLLT